MKGGADIVFGEGSRCCNLGERESKRFWFVRDY